jgi:hypothetical protein
VGWVVWANWLLCHSQLELRQWQFCHDHELSFHWVQHKRLFTVFTYVFYMMCSAKLSVVTINKLDKRSGLWCMNAAWPVIGSRWSVTFINPNACAPFEHILSSHLWKMLIAFYCFYYRASPKNETDFFFFFFFKFHSSIFIQSSKFLCLPPITVHEHKHDMNTTSQTQHEYDTNKNTTLTRYNHNKKMKHTTW